jgi:hypothetical protein
MIVLCMSLQQRGKGHLNYDRSVTIDRRSRVVSGREHVSFLKLACSVRNKDCLSRLMSSGSRQSAKIKIIL